MTSKHDATPPIDYIRRLYSQDDALLGRIAETFRERNMAIQVAPEEGKLLQLLVALHQPMKIVEVGTLGGYSALWMARALPPGGHLYTLERDAEHAALARSFFAESDVADRITLLEGDAHESLRALEKKAPFDMIFIDADKISYPDYLEWAEKHLRPGGLVVADNTFLFGAVWQDSPPEGTSPAAWQAMRHFNERLADASRFLGTIVPTHEGLSVAVRR